MTRTCGFQTRDMSEPPPSAPPDRILLMDVRAGGVSQGVCRRDGLSGSSLGEPPRRGTAGQPSRLAHLAWEEPSRGGAVLPGSRRLPWGLTFHFSPLPGWS